MISVYHGLREFGKRERPGVIVTPDYNAPWHSDATPLVLGGSAPLRPPARPTPASVGAWAHIMPQETSS